jgi:glycosyltransferase involved in cell wall biosynthesis
MNHKSTVYAHCLVKNESRWLWFAVTSIIDHVDKLLLWDTGSTDGSLEIERELVKKYPDKILFKERKIETPDDFANARQEMLDATKSDWFIVLDGDEIWWEESIRTLLSEIDSADENVEAFVVPTVNPVGDIFHFQEESAGMYRFGNLKGHYNLRAVRRNIQGLHSKGIHGVWGWADGSGKQIQDRNTYKVIKAPYLHTTFLPRASTRAKDEGVIKRSNKLKYELGNPAPFDYYYPEVLFRSRPVFIESPWKTMSLGFKARAFFETPLRKIKRRLFVSKPGY